MSSGPKPQTETRQALADILPPETPAATAAESTASTANPELTTPVSDAAIASSGTPQVPNETLRAQHLQELETMLLKFMDRRLKQDRDNLDQILHQLQDDQKREAQLSFSALVSALAGYNSQTALMTMRPEQRSMAQGNLERLQRIIRELEGGMSIIEKVQAVGHTRAFLKGYMTWQTVFEDQVETDYVALLKITPSDFHRYYRESLDEASGESPGTPEIRLRRSLEALSSIPQDYLPPGWLEDLKALLHNPNLDARTRARFQQILRREYPRMLMEHFSEEYRRQQQTETDLRDLPELDEYHQLNQIEERFALLKPTTREDILFARRVFRDIKYRIPAVEMSRFIETFTRLIREKMQIMTDREGPQRPNMEWKRLHDFLYGDIATLRQELGLNPSQPPQQQ